MARGMTGNDRIVSSCMIVGSEKLANGRLFLGSGLQFFQVLLIGASSPPGLIVLGRGTLNVIKVKRLSSYSQPGNGYMIGGTF